MGRILTAYNLLFLFDVLTKVLNDITKSSVNCNPITRSHTSHSQLFILILWCSDKYGDVKKKTVEGKQNVSKLDIIYTVPEVYGKVQYFRNATEVLIKLAEKNS